MKRALAIVMAACVALVLVWLTNRNKLEGRASTGETNAVLVQNDQHETVVALSKPEDPGQRTEIAAMMKEIQALDEDQWLHKFYLTGSDDKPVSSDDLKGQPYIANFFFSTCPGSCKQQTDQIRLLQDRYRNDPIRFVSITVHPAYDTPDKLAAYAAESAGAIDGKWLFLTGDMKQISRIGNDIFLLGAIKEFGHPDRLCLVNADGVLVGKYNWHDSTELEQLNAHVRELLDIDKK